MDTQVTHWIGPPAVLGDLDSLLFALYICSASIGSLLTRVFRMDGCLSRMFTVLLIVGGIAYYADQKADERKRREEIARIENTPELWPEYKALKLAVAANMRSKSFVERCGALFDRTTITSTIAVVPFNNDILNAASLFSERYSKKFGRLQNSVQQATHARMVNSDTIAFALFVVNDGLDEATGEVLFEGGLSRSLALQDEHGTSFQPSRYTRNFDERLSTGANSGFFYAPNPSANSDASYTLHLSNLVIKPCPSAGPKPRSTTFVYTKPNFDYLALVRTGMTETSLHDLPGMERAKSSNSETVRNVQVWITLINGLVTLARTIGIIP